MKVRRVMNISTKCECQWRFSIVCHLYFFQGKLGYWMCWIAILNDARAWTCETWFDRLLWTSPWFRRFSDRISPEFSRWCFQICFFHPYMGKWSILTNIFQIGWNHQVDSAFSSSQACSTKNMTSRILPVTLRLTDIAPWKVGRVSQIRKGFVFPRSANFLGLLLKLFVYPGSRVDPKKILSLNLN